MESFKKFFNNVNWLNPKLWGKYLWFWLDAIILTYPNNPWYETKQIYKNFFYLLQYVLPCEICKINYKKKLDSYPLTDEILKWKHNLFEWINKIHNETIKKKISLENRYKFYINECINFNKNKKLKHKFLFFILIFIFILFIFYLCRNKFIKFFIK